MNLYRTMERRMSGNAHVRCEAGENPKIASKDYLSLFPKIESAEMMFSASRSRRLQIVPIIQSFSQLEKNYGKEGAEIIIDNTQLTIFGGFAPNSSSAEVLSKALGSRTVQTGSVSQGRNDPSQSIQMIERPLLTADELKTLPKGRFVVMKTGYHPMQVNLKLFFKWGITFDGESYMVEDRGNRKVAYADRAEIVEAILKKYHPDREAAEPPARAVSSAGGIQASEWNEPQGKSRARSGGARLYGGPREIQETSPPVSRPPKPEAKADGQAR